MEYPMNAAVWDRVVRVALGLLMLIFGWRGDGGSWSLALRVFALYPLITGLAGWCPIYALLQASTYRGKR